MKIPTSPFARGAKLLKLASNVAAKELGAKLQGSKYAQDAQKLLLRVDQTKLLVSTLSQMKGAAMKAGQLLSLEAADIIPKEVLDVLAQLQSDGPSLPIESIRLILQEELGAERFAQLEDLSVLPLASASIGQVHEARVQGQHVVFKVQFPRVAESIDSDIRLLSSLVTKLSFLTGKKAKLDAVFEEIRQTLHIETDYRQELAYMLRYRANFLRRPGFIVPAPLPEFSTGKVLCMEFMPGMKLKDWIDSDPPAGDRQRIAEKALELYLFEYLECGLVQTDPNFGNFLVTDKLDLVLLDFGACKEYSHEFRQVYRQVLQATMDRDSDRILEVSYAFGLLDPRESDEVKVLHVKMMETLISPFRIEGAFPFDEETYSQETRDITMEVVRALKFTPPPKDLIFLHRKLAGVFQLMKRLGARIDLSESWKVMMGSV